MKLTFSEQIRIEAGRRGVTMGKLAELTGQTRQNLSNKMSRDNFTIDQMQAIAAALGCDLDIRLIDAVKDQDGREV